MPLFSMLDPPVTLVVWSQMLEQEGDEITGSLCYFLSSEALF